jgi:hypothetical protein
MVTSKIAWVAWKFFASFEFAATVVVGALLYLAGAVFFAARVYLTALAGLFGRAVILWRVRGQPDWKEKLAAATPNAKLGPGQSLSEAPPCGAVGRGRSSSRVN